MSQTEITSLELSCITKQFTDQISESQRTPQNISALEEMARKLVGKSLLRRSNNNEEKTSQQINKTIEEEKKRFEVYKKEHDIIIEAKIFQLFQNIQERINEFGCEIKSPELVVIGKQSEGKSKFIEALIGIPLNIFDSTNQLKCPLIIEMCNGLNTDPIFTFQNQITNKFDTSIPFNMVSNEILQRSNNSTDSTTSLLKQPIVLKIEHSNTFNFTIINIPETTSLSSQSSKSSIEELIKEYVSDPKRIILSVQTDSNEPFNIINDCHLQRERIIYIHPKLSEKLKINGKSVVEEYNKQHFYISLPNDQCLTRNELEKELDLLHYKDVEVLIRNGYEKKFEGIGMKRVINTIEHICIKQQTETLLTILSTLRSLIEKNTMNKQYGKKEILWFVNEFGLTIEQLLKGENVVDIKKYGETLIQEKNNSGVGEWLNFNFDFNVVSEDLKLYGGAQFNRLVNEIDYVLFSREIPYPSIDEVYVSVGLIHGGEDSKAVIRAVKGIVKTLTPKAILPVVDTAMKRIEYVFIRLYTIGVTIIEKKMNEEYNFNERNGTKQKLELIIKEKFEEFIHNKKVQCKQLIEDDLNSMIESLDWKIIWGWNEKYYDIGNTKQRVEEVINKEKEKEEMVQQLLEKVKIWDLDEIGYQSLCEISQYLFNGIRNCFSILMRNKLNTFFLQPLLNTFKFDLNEYFRNLNDKQYFDLIHGDDNGYSTGNDYVINLHKTYEELTLLKNLLENCNVLKSSHSSFPQLIDLKNPLQSELQCV